MTILNFILSCYQFKKFNEVGLIVFIQMIILNITKFFLIGLFYFYEDDGVSMLVYNILHICIFSILILSGLSLNCLDKSNDIIEFLL